MSITMELPFSQACENNKQPILQAMLPYLKGIKSIFEIGSGTAQHAVYFAQALPFLTWQCSDLGSNLPGINARLQYSGLANTPAAVEFDVAHSPWPTNRSCFFSANTAHIMPWVLTQKMIRQVGEALSSGGFFFLYGPFNYRGEFTSESNRRFNDWLQHGGSHQGIRDFEKIQEVATHSGLELVEDVEMPANNRLLLWRKAH